MNRMWCRISWFKKKSKKPIHSTVLPASAVWYYYLPPHPTPGLIPSLCMYIAARDSFLRNHLVGAAEHF